MIDLGSLCRNVAFGALVFVVLPAAGCVTTNFLERAETAKLLEVDEAERQTPDDVRAKQSDRQSMPPSTDSAR